MQFPTYNIKMVLYPPLSPEEKGEIVQTLVERFRPVIIALTEDHNEPKEKDKCLFP